MLLVYMCVYMCMHVCNIYVIPYMYCKCCLVHCCSIQGGFENRSYTFDNHLTFDINIVNTSKTTKIVKRVLKV